jgi:adenine-specific DNA methylase
MCSVVARSVLNIQRKKNEIISDLDLKKITTASAANINFDAWGKWLELEDSAVQAGHGKKVFDISRQTPLFWRKNTNEVGRLFLEAVGSSGFKVGPLISYTQAGYYFGIRQSLEIDSLRLAIENLFLSGTLSYWQYNASLSALLSAMSSAVNSAGKHFAQPLIAGTASNTDFIYKRLLQDRRISILECFTGAIAGINSLPMMVNKKHSVECTDVNTYLENTKRKYSLIYADPPYTAQQYSRFYHLLETAIKYHVPDMMHEGRITSGLYPKDRFMSQYCSKRQAPAAFSGLISAAKNMQAHLILSYSTSSSASTGNARMISLEDLLKLCRDSYGKGKVRTKELNHQYRQFNSGGNSNSRRDDPEVMIICRP